MGYTSKGKEAQPVLAICYDFDRTLSPEEMQNGYIRSVGFVESDFWKESNALADQNDMDQNLAYMYKMLTASEGQLAPTKANLQDYGSGVTLFPGVEEWFERIRKYGKRKGVIVEHYIISCGLKEIIEGTSVAKKGAFKRIYASSFYYNERGAAKWPAQVVNYTSKTQFLFRIEKGVLDVNDFGVNDYFAPHEVRVPFRNMVYIGDSDTDIPCMKLVNSHGGHSIGVFDPSSHDKSKVHKMIRDGRIGYYAPADYSEGTELDRLVKAIIDKTATQEVLESAHHVCQQECELAEKHKNEEERRKSNLLLALSESRSFGRTHELIRELSTISAWTTEEVEWLCVTAISNSQVFFILGDPDVRVFYKKVLRAKQSTNENVKKVKDALKSME